MDTASLLAPLAWLRELIGAMGALTLGSAGMLAGIGLLLVILGYILGRRRRPEGGETTAGSDDGESEAAEALAAHEAARAAADMARREAEDARRTADADLVTALSRAERAEALATGQVGQEAELRRALAEAEASAAAARASEEALRASMAETDGSAPIAAMAEHDRGRAPLTDATMAATAYLDHHGAAIASASRIMALAALNEGGQGLDTACRHVAAARLHAATLPATVAEDVSVLHETLNAARALGGKLSLEPVAAQAAGLPRLAEALWRDAAARADTGAATATALARAAEAALAGGRWPTAMDLARAALDTPRAPDEAWDATAEIGARLTHAQASVFNGVTVDADTLLTLATEAAEVVGPNEPVTIAARRLAARVAFEGGDMNGGDEIASSLGESGIDPLVDPSTRAARARGLLLNGRASDAKGQFEALARQASAGSRAALGHKLDALEAGLAAGANAATILAELDKLATPLSEAFGLRHPRAGHLSLLTALAHAAADDDEAARGAAARAEALLSLRLAPTHRWRIAARDILGGGDDAAVAPEDDDTAHGDADEGDGSAPALLEAEGDEAVSRG